MATDRQRLNELRRLDQLRRRAEIPQPELTPSQQAIAGDQDFLSRVGEDLRGRVGEAEDIRRGFETGESGLASTALQRLGLGFGTGADIAGEALTSGFRALPDIIEDPLRRGAGAVGEFVGESALGQLAGRGIEAAGEKFAELDPNVQRNLRALAEITPFAIPGGVVSKPVAAAARGVGRVTPDVGRMGERLIKAGDVQIEKRKQDFLEDLVTPLTTPKEERAVIRAGRKEEGGLAFKERKTVLSPFEKEISVEVGKIPEISNKNTFLKNNDIILQNVDKKAKQLVKDLEGKDINFPRQLTKARVRNSIEKTIEGKKAVFGTGELRGKAEGLLEDINTIVDKNPSTPAGILKSRKELDNIVEAAFGDVHSVAKDSPQKLLSKALRNSLNDLLAEKAPTVAVKESLRSQHLLLEALDTVSAKARLEAPTKMGRLIQNITKTLPKSVTGKLLTVGAVGTGGFVPGVLTTIGLGGAGFLTAKALRSPATKRKLGQILKLTDQSIKKSTDPELLKQLKADKAVLIGLINKSQEHGEE